MNTLADLQSEVATLRSEVARLREEAALFFIINRDEAGKVSDTQLRCWRLECEMVDLRDRDSRESSGIIGVDDQGAYVSLFGSDRRSKALFRVTENSGEIELTGADHHPVVRVFEQDGHGHVAVFSPGNIPRALMKGMETGGVLTALGEDGLPLSIVRSNGGKGSVVVLDEERKARAEMIAEKASAHFMTFGSNGKKGSLLSSGPDANSLLLMNPEGEVGVSAASTARGNIVSVGTQPSEENPHAAITIADLPDLGGSICVRDEEGRRAIDLSTNADGGVLRVDGSDPGAHVSLQIHQGGGRVEAAHLSGESLAILFAPESGGFIHASGPNENSVILNVAPIGSSISLRHGEETRFFAGTGDDTNAATVFMANHENLPVLQIFSGPEGGTVLACGSDGTVQAGFAGSDAGGKLTVFSELGVERASLRSVDDGGGLHLKWGGTTGLVAAATARGGIITAHGADGTIVQTLPDPENFDEDDEEED